jgi:glyoxylase-like metal-dependent hydrolase (beta-lactamase superfamily II)
MLVRLHQSLVLERSHPMSDATPALSATRVKNGITRPLDRRRLLRGTAGLAGAAIAAPAAAALLGAPSRVAAFEAGQLHTFTSPPDAFDTKTFFYDSGTEVVAFDTQFTPDLAVQAIAFLRTKTDRPLAYAVISHPNPDKFNGLTAFQQEGAKVVASRATVEAMPGVHEYKKAFFVGAGMFTEATYPKLGSVDVAFDGELTLYPGGQTVELRELSQPGISSNQTVAHIPGLDALIVGDLVHHKAHAWLEGGIVNGKPTPTLDGWIADLNELSELFPGGAELTVYGGRGETAPLPTAVADQIAYLRRADQIVSDYVAGLGARKSELSGPKANEHYAALQKEFEAAFPDYALSYMILFGVYGLVNSKL